MTKEIKTPWGKIIPEVNLFPIYYLLFIYCFVYILPYGKFYIGISWFDWFRSEDGVNRGEGPLEWIQFIQYAAASLFSIMIFLKIKKKSSINAFIWLIFFSSCFLIAAEEISWGERIFGFTINSVAELCIQGETNLHNLPFLFKVKNTKISFIFHMKNYDFQEKKFQISDPIENYFECISICDVRDGNCISRCVEILKKNEN